MSSDSQKSNSALDTDYDNDSWLGEKEKTFSTKLIVALGGISSLGGVFPLFLDKAQFLIPSFLDSSVWLFIFFSFGYFALPLAILGFWVWFTDRIAYPNNWSPLKGFRIADWKNSPITYRYQWLIILQFLLVSLYLVVSIKYQFQYRTLFGFGFSLILFVAPVIGFLSMTKRSYPRRKSPVKMGATMLLVVLLVSIYLGFKWRNSAGHDASDGDYRKLVQVDLINRELQRLEKEILNMVDRFYIKSSVQAKVTLDTIQGVDVPTGFNANKYRIDASLRILGRILLEDESCCKTSLNKHAHASENDSDVIPHRDLFLGEEFTYQAGGNRRLDVLMSGIDSLLISMEQENRHRVFPSCFDADPFVSDTTGRLAEQLAAKFNFDNSKRLKSWVEDFYLPYCQRKAKADVEEIAQETAWIWKDMQLRGVAISVANLILLFLFFIEMNDLKLFKIAGFRADGNGDESEEEKEIRSKKIAELNHKANYLLFPLTMAMTVIGLLLIPVTAQMEIASFTPSRSFWLMNVPSLHLPEVTDQVVSNSKEETQITEMDTITSNISTTVDRSDSIPTTPTTSNGIKEEIKILNSRLNALTKALENRKNIEKELEGISSSLKKVQKKVDDLPNIVSDGWGATTIDTTKAN
ncbi:MAG: hypothetical protein H6602_04625 [Flavobacteriales bacterium]|nr:hypothetical protein [Flavobacteriales bacterium]